MVFFFGIDVFTHVEWKMEIYGFLILNNENCLMETGYNLIK